MRQYIAFLRGINVSGRRMKMDRLRALFRALGLRDVSTFIASGNVSFSTDSEDVARVRERIEGHLENQLGYEVATFLRSPAELASIIAFSPPNAVMPTPSAWSRFVMFLDPHAPDSLRSTLTELNSEMDHFYFSESEVHWHIKGKLSESPLFGPGLERATRGVRTTTRNMNTLQRIATKIEAFPIGSSAPPTPVPHLP